MGKLKFFTVLSKCFAYITWAASNVIVFTGKVSRKTISKLKNTERYNVHVYNNVVNRDTGEIIKQPIKTIEDIGHSELTKMIDSIEVYPDMLICITNYEGKNVL